MPKENKESEKKETGARTAGRKPTVPRGAEVPMIPQTVYSVAVAFNLEYLLLGHHVQPQVILECLHYYRHRCKDPPCVRAERFKANHCHRHRHQLLQSHNRSGNLKWRLLALLNVQLWATVAYLGATIASCFSHAKFSQRDLLYQCRHYDPCFPELHSNLFN